MHMPCMRQLPGAGGRTMIVALRIIVVEWHTAELLESPEVVREGLVLGSQAFVRGVFTVAIPHCAATRARHIPPPFASSTHGQG